MEDQSKNIIWQGLAQALIMTLYIGVVAWLMFNARIIFGQIENFLGPLAFLMLFSLSAAVLGLLMFGQATVRYLDGRKAEAVKLVLSTGAWFGIITFVLLISQLVF